MENDMKVQRFDSLPLDATYFTDEGYLVDHPIVVALLAEGGDRNFGRLRGKPQHIPSPSSRRAQVEIDTKIW